ncbi:hypothetical protein [Leptospira brenneri]|uniref:hypothetical protein n=1 Tax=Leptospira brenneri TaxID=2023182 RepID=UPI000C29DA92|nr:hypothetical protein [Leptospira brenneri]PJZ43719.1 hypothetical protein CH361_18910 [Leptospira brenneri]
MDIDKYLLSYISIFLFLSCDIEITEKENKKRCDQQFILNLIATESGQNSEEQKRENTEFNSAIYAYCLTGPKPFGGTIQDTIKAIKPSL